MPKRSAKMRNLHFRADDALIEDLDAFAASLPDGNRSQAIRMLLHQALGNDAQRAAATEAIYAFQGTQKRVLRRLAGQMQDLLPSVVEEELRQSGG